jgi:hypothetical protein
MPTGTLYRAATAKGQQQVCSKIVAPTDLLNAVAEVRKQPRQEAFELGSAHDIQ